MKEKDLELEIMHMLQEVVTKYQRDTDYSFLG